MTVSRLPMSAQKGAFLPFIVLTLIPFILVIGMVFNTGAQVIRKQTLQNAADASALSQATLTARSMNLIAMNNTAITQAFALNIMGVTALPILVEMDVRAAKEGVEIGKLVVQAGTNAAACAASAGVNVVACGAAAVQGGEATARGLHLGFKIIDPLIDLHRDAISAAGFGTVADALGEMNRRVADEFPEQSAAMQSQIAQANSLRYRPRLIAAYTTPTDVPGAVRYVTTDLPVDLIDPLDLGQMETTVGAMAPIKRTGESGSASFPGQRLNFNEHGYTAGEGPYDRARQRAIDEITKVHDALEKKYPGPGSFSTWPNEPLSLDYEDALNIAWNLQSVLHQSLNLTGFSIDFIQVYALRQDFMDAVAGGVGGAGLFYDGNDLSVFAVTGDDLSGGPVFPSRFNNAPGAVYGMAQAEIYNDVYHDMYTQDWKAKLRSNSMLTDSEYRNAVVAALQHNRSGDGDLYAALSGLLSSLDASTLEAVNVH